MSIATRAVRIYHSRALLRRPGLFEDGDPSDAPDDDAYARRLNLLIAVESDGWNRKRPVDLGDSILPRGVLDRDAEMILFGRWLLTDGMPGRTARGGRPINPRLVLCTVAACLAELGARQRLQKAGMAVGPSLGSRITATPLATRWEKLFSESAKASDFTARLRTLKSVLPDYLNHLKTGGCAHAGVQIRSSPQIKAVLDALTHEAGAISPPLPPPAPVVTVGHGSPAPPVSLTPFSIALCYATPDREAEYRNIPAASAPAARLSYRVTPVMSSSPTGAIRKDLEQRIRIEPDVQIQASYRVKALIDRIVILITTRSLTGYAKIQNAISREVGAIIFVHDRTIKNEKGDWQRQLPALDMSKVTGQHFAIMIQEPEPDKLAKILEIVDRDFGIVGEVELFLLELSVDFHPRETFSPAERLILREQMVGLLQRHHWAAHSKFLTGSQDVPRYSDARQVYGGTPRYFFAEQKKAAFHSDGQIREPDVRDRILNAKPGNDLYLNSTIYKGAKETPLQINIQHKIADRRDPVKKTEVVLKDQERRARIEVTVTGRDQLKSFGLEKIGDLANVSFRSMTENLLRFRLGTAANDQILLDDAKAQMKTRGVYGIEFRERARLLEAREKTRPRPRKTDRDGLALVDWPEMNTLVGKALDVLRQRWKKFA